MPQFENMSAEHYTVDTDLHLSNFSHCHIGILHHFDHLSELLQLMGDAEAAKKIAKEAVDYFHLGMKAHHQEEERELFPAVLSSAILGEERTLVEQLIEKLTQEHRSLGMCLEKLMLEGRKLSIEMQRDSNSRDAVE